MGDRISARALRDIEEMIPGNNISDIAGSDSVAARTVLYSDEYRNLQEKNVDAEQQTIAGAQP